MKDGLPIDLETLIKKGVLVAGMHDDSYHEIIIPRTGECRYLSDCLGYQYDVGNVLVYQFDSEAIRVQVENTIVWMHEQYGVSDNRVAVVVYGNIIRPLNADNAAKLARNGNVILNKVAQEFDNLGIRGVIIKPGGTTARGIAVPGISDLDINLGLREEDPDLLRALIRVTENIESDLHITAVLKRFSHIDLHYFR